MIGTRRITRRSFLAAAGLAAVGASLSLTGCSGSVSDGLSSKHLLVAHSHSETHPVNVGLQKMTEVASAESDLTFSVYPNGQLGDNAAMIQLVKAGVLDIAKVSASSMEQFNSAYAIFSMPYVFESTEQYFAVMNQSEAVQEIFKSTYDQGFFAIGWFDSGSRSIYTTKDGPCEGPADLKGLKIRTQDSPTSIAMIRAMGGSATPMSSGETYTGLQQGIIDGAENNETVLVQDGHGEVCKSYTYTQHQMVPDIVIISTETWESLDEAEQSAIVNGMTQGNEAHEAVWQDLVQDGHGEVCKSYTYTQHQMVPDIVIISTETWESLDEAEQSAIVNGMTQGNEAHEAVWQDLVQENIDGAKEMGVQFYTIDKTAFIEATQSLRDEFCAKSADNARYYEDFLSYVQA